MVKITVAYEGPLIPERTKSSLFITDYLHREMNPLYNSSGQAYFKSDLAWVCL